LSERKVDFMQNKKVDFVKFLAITISFFVLWFACGCSTKNLTQSEKVGSILVESTISGANIILDNAATGKQTPDTLFNVRVGSHKIEVEKEGYLPSPISIMVEVKADTIVQASFILLDLKYGSLEVNSNVQGATIVIDNVSTKKQTPFLFDHNLPIGTHIVSVFEEGYSNDLPAKEVVTVTTKDTVVVNFNLSPATVGPDAEGELAPNFELLDDYSDTIELYNYRGFVVIVQFWGSSCLFCIQELDFLQEQYNKYSIDSLKIFAVNYEDELAYLQEKRAEKNLTFNLLLGKESQMLKDYHLTPHVTETPITIIIDRSGLIYSWVLGYSAVTRTEMRQAFSELFGH
jgi:peroxiredoxin